MLFRVTMTLIFSIVVLLPIFAQENVPLQLAKKRMFNSNYIEYRTAPMFKKMAGKMYFREKGTNDVYRKIGFYGKHLKPYITPDSESMKYFKRYRFKKAMDDFTSVGIGIAGAVYIRFALDNITQGYGISDSFFGRKNVGISIATYILMAVGNGYFGPSSENDLLHAILLGNGFDAGLKTSSLKLKSTEDGQGIMLALEF